MSVSAVKNNALVASIAQLEVAPTQTENKIVVQKCPGHSEFFHRYIGEKKANKKGEKKVKETLKDKNIQSASLKIMSKSSPEGKESGLFKGLNKVYKFAVFINYTHNDNCEACSHHPENAKKA